MNVDRFWAIQAAIVPPALTPAMMTESPSPFATSIAESAAAASSSAVKSRERRDGSVPLGVMRKPRYVNVVARLEETVGKMEKRSGRGAGERVNVAFDPSLSEASIRHSIWHFGHG